MTESDQILDLPDQENKRGPKTYYQLLLVGIAALVVGMILDWTDHYQLGTIFKVISFVLIALHFVLKIVVNWGLDLGQSLRDVGQAVAIAGIYGRFYFMEGSVYVIIAGFVVYMFGFVVGRNSQDAKA